MTRRMWGAGTLVAVLGLVGFACSGDDDTSTGATGAGSSPDSSASADADPVPGGTLVFGLASENTGYNPAVDQVTLSGYQVAAAVYDVLVRYDEDGQWHPFLAESIVPNDDFTEWEITLREGIEFHDGTPLDSTVLKMNLDAQKDSPLLGQAVGPMERIDIVDDLTVNVVMSTPWASFPHTMTAQPGLIVAPSVLQDPDGGRNPVGTGPFVFDEWVLDQHLTVNRNENYWREGYPLLDRIEFRIIADTSSRAAALESGDVHVIEARNGDQIGDFEAREDEGEFVVYVDDRGETTEDVVFLNTATAPFDDPVAREAVHRAIDKEALSEVLTGGRYAPAEGPFKETSPWYQGVAFPSYDQVRAQGLADEYEATHGEPIAFSFKTGSDPTSIDRATLIQQMLLEVGIDMEVATGEVTAQLVEVLLGDYQAGTTDVLFGSTHPDREYVFLHGDNALPVGQMGIAFTRVVNPEIDDGLDGARTTDDLAEQSAHWKQVQEALAEDMAFVFLAHDDIGDVASVKVRDVLDWTLPDGTPGLVQSQNVLSVYQMWLEQ